MNYRYGFFAILLILFFATNIYAQNYTTQQDSLFQHLNKEKIHTGVLYDRVYPWSNLHNEQVENFVNSKAIAKQVWLELATATYNQDNIIGYEEMLQRLNSKDNERDLVTIGLIDYEFNYLSPNAINEGLVYFGEDSLLYESDGNPYLSKTITLPVLSNESVKGDYLKFFIDSEIILSKTSRSLENISISIGKNKTLFLQPNVLDSLYIGDVTDSIINLSFDLYFTGLRIPITVNNSVLNVNQIILTPMMFNQNKCVTYDTIWSGTDLKFKGYSELSPSQGFGEFTIFHRQMNNSWSYCAEDIYKPIIIIDGFDPGDKRKIVSDDLEPGLWELLKYDGNNKHLGDTLRKMGYDVILLNFPEYRVLEFPIPYDVRRDGGADYIERNAMVLIKLIQYVKGKLNESGSSEEIVIVGPSMGGQIARYALTYMEKQEALGDPAMAHNTRLYVSFDSPHLGANIPLSLQNVIYAMGFDLNHSDAKDSYNLQLKSPAAKQMLIEHRDGANKTSTYFLNYYSSLYLNGIFGNDGWPMNLREIALINGMANGTNTGTPEEKILGFQVGGQIPILEVEANNLPNYTDSISLYYKVKGFDLDNIGGSLFYRPPITDGIRNNNRNGSMDIVPGGTFTTARILLDMVEESVSDLNIMGLQIANVFVNKIKDVHTFIPSVSALSFKDRNFDWSTRFDDRNLVCTDEIPFDNYFYAVDSNESHVFISKEAAEWVLEEIEKGNEGCPRICKDEYAPENDLSPICINSTRVFYHNYFITPSNFVTWDIESSNNSLEIINTTNDYIVVKGINNEDDVRVKFTISNPCGADIRGEYKVDVGISPQDIVIRTRMAGTNARVANYKPDYYSYQWRLMTIPYWINSDGALYPYSLNNDQATPNNILYLKSTNSCGWATSGIFVNTIALPDLKDTLIVSPNPARETWNLTFLNSAEKQISLYSVEGKLIYNTLTSDVQVKISAEGLPVGMYFLRVRNGDKEETIKLLKE